MVCGLPCPYKHEILGLVRWGSSEYLTSCQRRGEAWVTTRDVWGGGGDIK